MSSGESRLTKKEETEMEPKSVDLHCPAGHTRWMQMQVATVRLTTYFDIGEAKLQLDEVFGDILNRETTEDWTCAACGRPASPEQCAELEDHLTEAS